MEWWFVRIFWLRCKISLILVFIENIKFVDFKLLYCLGFIIAQLFLALNVSSPKLFLEHTSKCVSVCLRRFEEESWERTKYKPNQLQQERKTRKQKGKEQTDWLKSLVAMVLMEWRVCKILGTYFIRYLGGRLYYAFISVECWRQFCRNERSRPLCVNHPISWNI
jgi:hypothetical protein